jgi:hypothetical protein
MGDKGIELDCICEYDDAVIYRFLTEELFEQEMIDLRFAGMVQHFTYEEFHPNHDYDLRRYVNEFAQKLYSNQWHPEYDTINFTKEIIFKGNRYDREGVSKIIHAFQDAQPFMELIEFEINHLDFNLSLKTGKANGHLIYSSSVSAKHRGEWETHFSYDDELGYWNICEFQMPGLE